MGVRGRGGYGVGGMGHKKNNIFFRIFQGNLYSSQTWSLRNSSDSILSWVYLFIFLYPQVKRDKLVGFSNLSRQSPQCVATFVVKLLPALCEHLEATSAFFQVGSKCIRCWTLFLRGAVSCLCLHPGTQLIKLLEISTKKYLITKRNS